MFSEDGYMATLPQGKSKTPTPNLGGNCSELRDASLLWQHYYFAGCSITL